MSGGGDGECPILQGIAVCHRGLSEGATLCNRSRACWFCLRWRTRLKALDTLLDNAIVLVNDDGSVQSKKEFLASVRATNSQEQQVAPESMSVRVFGSTAIATGVMRVKGVEGGKPYVRREQFVDTWVNKGGRWVCVATDATPVVH